MLKVGHLIALCLIGGVAVILSLFGLSRRHDAIGGGFDRSFKNTFLQRRGLLDLKYNSYYVSGIIQDTVYLGNVTLPSHFLKVSLTSQDTSHTTMKLPSKTNFVLAGLQIKLEADQIFAFETITPAYLHGSTSDWLLSNTEFKKIPFLGFPEAISPWSFVVTSYDSTKRKSILAKVHSTLQPLLQVADVLEKQVDGVFCTDGILLYDKQNTELLYIYHYRNGFVRLDTNLNVIGRGHTIDTISRTRLKVEKILSENTYSLSAPPLEVNKRACLYRNWLLVQSKVDSDNELNAKDSETIDLYFGNNRQYEFSISLPNMDDGLMSFAATKDFLVAVEGRYLVTYSIHWPSD